MSHVQAAYSLNADRYVQALGAVSQMEPCDVALISSWSASVNGKILDAGCGPGHWSDVLSKGGAEVLGIDLVPEFISVAKQRFPAVHFEVSDMESTSLKAESLSGVLAWYSMIHFDQRSIDCTLGRLRNALRDGGSVLLGFFVGPHFQQFPHAVTDAYYWDVDKTCEVLDLAGFRVDEVHTRSSARHRDHGAIVAVKQ